MMFRELADAYEAGDPGASWLLARVMAEVLGVKREQQLAELFSADAPSIGHGGRNRNSGPRGRPSKHTETSYEHEV